jgi:Tfp pilus assembly protein PilP
MIKILSLLLTLLFLNVCQAKNSKVVPISDAVEIVSENASGVTPKWVKKSRVGSENSPNKQPFALPSEYSESQHICGSDARNTDLSLVTMQLDYELKGILYSTGGHYTALLKSISGHSLVVRTGQRVGKAQVVQITEDSLRLRQRQLNSLGCPEEHDLEWPVKQSG